MAGTLPIPFIETERTLGKKPDLRSTAKTTYSITLDDPVLRGAPDLAH